LEAVRHSLTEAVAKMLRYKNFTIDRLGSLEIWAAEKE
jgi:hypothetical protein